MRIECEGVNGGRRQRDGIRVVGPEQPDLIDLGAIGRKRKSGAANCGVGKHCEWQDALIKFHPRGTGASSFVAASATPPSSASSRRAPSSAESP